MSRVNLLIACYGGPRRTYDPAYEQDRGCYLKRQLDSLVKYEHNLEQVTLISNGGRSDYQYCLNRILNDIEECVYDFKVEVVERENIGMSYGAWDTGWKMYPDFDYYIFLEDDYLFVKNKFDQDMVGIYENFKDCGYLCSMAAKDARSNWIYYPAIMNGMISRSNLERFANLPGSAGKVYEFVEQWGQRGWGIYLSHIGLNVCDMGFQFQAPFQEKEQLSWWYYNAPEIILVPSQIYTTYHRNRWECRIEDEQWAVISEYIHRTTRGTTYLSMGDMPKLTSMLGIKLDSPQAIERLSHLYRNYLDGNNLFTLEKFLAPR